VLQREKGGLNHIANVKEIRRIRLKAGLATELNPKPKILHLIVVRRKQPNLNHRILLEIVHHKQSKPSKPHTIGRPSLSTLANSYSSNEILIDFIEIG
jgi:hypothetical protein